MRNAGEKREHGLTVIFTATLAALCVIVGSVIFGTFRTEAAPSETHYKYYTSIRVEKGDTLWTIADAYMTEEYENISDYIGEVCNINRISGDTIHAGQYLTVPYYSAKLLK